MEMSKGNMMIGLIIAGVASVIIAISVTAQSTSITASQRELIIANCTEIKTTLNQLHASDAILRVNAGQNYESILTKLMKRFNERAELNNMISNELEVTTTEFERLLNSFRTNYVNYEQRLSATIDIDCVSQPQVFYDSLALARMRRNDLHDSVQQLNLALESYKGLLDKFEVDNQTAIERLTK